MKRNSSTRSAFINPRALIGFVLLFVGVLLALFAFGAAPNLSKSNAQTGDSPGLFRFASAFGLHLDSQQFASLPASKGGGAGVPLSKTPGEPLPPTLEDQAPANSRDSARKGGGSLERLHHNEGVDQFSVGVLSM
jgi:hypothetical protein